MSRKRTQKEHILETEDTEEIPTKRPKKNNETKDKVFHKIFPSQNLICVILRLFKLSFKLFKTIFHSYLSKYHPVSKILLII